jgi:hypothetical protein
MLVPAAIFISSNNFYCMKKKRNIKKKSIFKMNINVINKNCRKGGILYHAK